MRIPPRGGLASWSLIALASALGALAFALPLLDGGAGYGGRGGPILLAATVALGLAVAVPEAGGRLGARAVALLAAIVAAASALRFVEVLLPGPGGFTPIFAPLILVGWAWGPRLGFLAGTLTLAVSAVATGGVGPWLPYQAIVAGWIGLTAGLLPGSRGGRRAPRGAVAGLAAFGALWGIGYGMLLSSWDWFALEAGRGAGDAGTALHRYAAFYLATSLGWDIFGALGNAALIALAGTPALAALARFRRWFDAPDRVKPDRTAPVAPIEPMAPIPYDLYDSYVVFPPPATPATSLTPFTPPHPATPPPAWLLWLVGALFTVSATRHPLVLLIALLAIATVRAIAAPAGAVGGRATLPLLRFAPVMVAVAAVYNLLAAHQGTTVLARLPEALPVIGGPLTLESLVYGLGAGLMLVAMIAAFLAFQQAVSRPGLLALVPRAFGAPALAAAVALAWLPGTLSALATVREAQLVRGIGVRGPRGWSALVVPVATGGLERAARLAESLALRGLVPAAAPTAVERLGLVAAMAVAAAGLLQALPAAPALGLAMVVAGIVFARVGTRLPRRAGRWAWRGADLAMVAGAWLPAALALASPGARATLAWSPYPTLGLAPLDPWVLVACAGLAAPALLARAARRPEDREAWTRKAAGTSVAAPDRAVALELGETGVPHACGGDTRPGRSGHGLAVAFRDIGFAYDAGGNRAGREVLRGVSFTASPGRIALITGPSGSGKSTLLRIACGIVPGMTGGRLTGTVHVGEHDARAMGPERLGHLIGLVPGDPDQSFVAEAVGDEVAAALEARGHGTAEVAARVAAVLGRVGLGGFQPRALATLSGGERQRVAIAAALAAGPAVLLLDEPTSQLDDDTAADLVAVLAALAARGTTVVVATHRPDRFAGHVGARLELEGADERDEMQGAWMGVGGRQGAGRGSGRGMPWDERGSGRGMPWDERGSGRSKQRPYRKRAVVGARHAAPSSSAPSSSSPIAPSHDAVLVHAAGVAFAWPGASPVLRDLDLAVAAGELVAILGASGAGKTTLLRLLIGRLAPTAGTLAIARRAPADAVTAGLVGYVPQDPEALLFAASVQEEVEATLSARHAGALSPGERRRRADTVIASVGLTARADQHPYDLSTGERQRAAIAAVLAVPRAVLLLDEPTRGLDDVALARLAATLRAVAAGGTAVIVATHDRRLAAAAHRCVRLNGGRLDDGRLDGVRLDDGRLDPDPGAVSVAPDADGAAPFVPGSRHRGALTAGPSPSLWP